MQNKTTAQDECLDFSNYPSSIGAKKNKKKNFQKIYHIAKYGIFLFLLLTIIYLIYSNFVQTKIEPNLKGTEYDLNEGYGEKVIKNTSEDNPIKLYAEKKRRLYTN